jgi:hypothetical protein
MMKIRTPEMTDACRRANNFETNMKQLLFQNHDVFFKITSSQAMHDTQYTGPNNTSKKERCIIVG